MKVGSSVLLLTLAVAPAGNPLRVGELSIPRAHPEPVWFVKFSPDGRKLASGCGDRAVHLWDAATGKRQPAILAARDVSLLGFTPDGKALATGGWDVRLWDPSTAKQRAVYTCPEPGFLTDALSSDGRTAASVKGTTILLWDLTSRKKLATLAGEGQDMKVFSMAFSPDGRTLATGEGGTWGDPGRVCLWDTATGRRRSVLKGHANVVSFVAFSPDGKLLASGSWDGTVRLWDAAPGNVRHILRGHRDAVWCGAFRPDGEMLATGSADKTARVWDTTTGQLRATLTHVDEVISLSYSPDGNVLAAGSGNPVDLSPGRCEIKLWTVPRLAPPRPGP